MIEFRNVSQSYKDHKVLTDINMTIQSGEFVVLIGSSGCGKTTLLKTINKLTSLAGGDLLIDGVSIRDIPDIALRRRIGYVIQDGGLFPHLTVEENISLLLETVGMPSDKIPARVDEVLEMVNLDPDTFRNSFPAQLSGGQKQRVAIARALVNKPKVLLLDEPLGALDLKLRKQMQIELKRLQKKLGITFIYVTHDQEEALTMSDRIAVMHDGVLEQLDVPMEIYEHPKTKFVAGFIGESNIFDGKVTDKKDNVLTVQTEAGMMQVCGADFEVGEEMHVAIRPEYMDVSKTPVEGFDLPGTVKDFIYQGTVVKTALDIKNGQEIKYSRFEQDTDIAEGNQVYVFWRPEKAVAIKKSM